MIFSGRETTSSLYFLLSYVLELAETGSRRGLNSIVSRLDLTPAALSTEKGRRLDLGLGTEPPATGALPRSKVALPDGMLGDVSRTLLRGRPPPLRDSSKAPTRPYVPS